MSVDTPLSSIPSTPSGRPSKVLADGLLPRLATEINKHCAAVKKAGRSAVEHAIEAGEKLIEAKRHAGHGNWLSWLCDNCPLLPERTAQLYMQMADHKDELAKSATVADLGFRQAVKMLAKPRDKAEENNISPESDRPSLMMMASIMVPATSKATSRRSRTPRCLRPKQNRRRPGRSRRPLRLYQSAKPLHRKPELFI
jgi:hypothetical protein